MLGAPTLLSSVSAHEQQSGGTTVSLDRQWEGEAAATFPTEPPEYSANFYSDPESQGEVEEEEREEEDKDLEPAEEKSLSYRLVLVKMSEDIL